MSEYAERCEEGSFMALTRHIKPLVLALVALFLGGLGIAAQADTLSVANNGIDSATCGTKDDPCRSISQAIAHASEGDTIVVGPGLYGDLNGNGLFSEPGEEVAEVNFGCVCMIKVTKRLTLVSSDSAAVTVLDVGGADLRGVVIQTDGVVFGEKGQGFTLANARRSGLHLDPTSGVTVVGNVAIRTGTNGNDAFVVQGSGHTIRENVALGNARAGFGVHGSGHLVSDNVASDNLLGFELTFSGDFMHNVASGNLLNGLVVNATELEIHHNAIIGNRQLGMQIFSSNVAITDNNIFGNGTIGGNCGLLNQTGTSLMASNNFWGAAGGPGPDPADAVCGDPPSTTAIAPVATKPFKIPVQAGR